MRVILKAKGKHPGKNGGMVTLRNLKPILTCVYDFFPRASEDIPSTFFVINNLFRQTLEQEAADLEFINRCVYVS